MRPSTSTPSAATREHPLQAFVTSHGLLLAGAWSLSATALQLPMLVAAGGALLLSAPLLRRLVRQRRTDHDRRSR
jgi:hypothetical protein